MKSFWSKCWEIYRPFRYRILVMFVLLALAKLVMLTYPYLFGSVISEVSQGMDMQKIFTLVLVSVVLQMIGMAITYCQYQYEVHYLDHVVPEYLRIKTLEKLFTLSIGQHRNEHSGMTQGIILEGQGSLRNTVSVFLYQVLPAAMELMIGLIAVIVFDWQCGLVALATVCLLSWYGYKLTEYYIDPLIKERRKYNLVAKEHSEIISHIPSIISSALEKITTKKHSAKIEETAAFSIKLWSKFGTAMTARNLLIPIAQGGILVLASYHVVQGKYSGGYLVSLFMWSGYVFANINNLFKIQRALLQDFAKVKKYLAILEIKPAVKVAVNPKQLPTVLGRIEFRNVSFCYPHQSVIDADEDSEEDKNGDSLPEEQLANETLQDFSMVIPVGQKVALVGPSGAGKSTIINLLLRGDDPNTGQILVDGIDLRELDLLSYRQVIGMVEQQIMLWDDTLRANILIGCNGQAERITDEEIMKVCEQTMITGFWDRLTNGLDTKIGQNGIKLSGGERQRVAIAAALIKNPRILIFDEATSSLDGINERHIKNAIDQAAKGRTTIIIAHRLSTVSDADKIIVVDKGRVVGEGKHLELLETCAVYQDLVEHQLVPK